MAPERSRRTVSRADGVDHGAALQVRDQLGLEFGFRALHPVRPAFVGAPQGQLVVHVLHGRRDDAGVELGRGCGRAWRVRPPEPERRLPAGERCIRFRVRLLARPPHHFGELIAHKARLNLRRGCRRPPRPPEPGSARAWNSRPPPRPWRRRGAAGAAGAGHHALIEAVDLQPGLHAAGVDHGAGVALRAARAEGQHLAADQASETLSAGVSATAVQPGSRPSAGSRSALSTSSARTRASLGLSSGSLGPGSAALAGARGSASNS
jgi:hypothetical protein